MIPDSKQETSILGRLSRIHMVVKGPIFYPKGYSETIMIFKHGNGKN